MSKEQISYNYSSDEVLKQEMEIHDLTLESIDKELPKTEAKSLAFSKLIAAVEQDLYTKVKRVNELVDEIKGFHETRIAATGTTEELNAVLATYNASLPLFPPLTPLNQATYDPNSSSNGNNYLNSTLNKAAWFSNIGLTSSISGFNTAGSGYDDQGVYNPQYNAEFVYGFQIKEECNIELNQEEHWDGQTTVQEYVEPEPGTYKPSAYGGPQLQDVPKLICPIEEVPDGAGIITINKINIKIYGYSLEGENPVEVKEADLNEDTVGIGTFNVLQDIKNTYDVGINTNNSVSFSYDGQSFSGDITEGSSNYNSYLKPRYDEIDDLRDEISGLMPDINKMKDMRKKSDLYTWSLKFSKSDTQKEKSKKEESLGTFDKFQDKYKDVLNFPEPKTEEVTRGKTFEELTEKEKKDLSEQFGLGFPKNIKKIKNPKTGKQELDKDGNPKWTTDKGFNKNYDDQKIKKFIKQNQGLTAFKDFTVTESGSIVVIDSVGTATTFTGITTQVNSITSGAMNPNNVGSGASITDQDFEFVGYTTGNILPSPAAEVGIAITYLGSIGVSTLAWREGYFDEVVANTFTGAATSIRACAIQNTLDEDLPLMIAVGANTEGKADVKPVVNSKLTYNPFTNELSVGIISATELIVNTGVIGVATAAIVEVEESATDGVLVFTDNIGITTFSNLLGDSGIRVNPSRNEIIASRFTGIISATDVTAGVTTLSELGVAGIITAAESEIAFFKTQNYSRSWPYTNWSNSQQGVTLQSIGRNIIIQAGGGQTTRSYVSLTNGGGVWIGGGYGDPEGVNINAGSGDVKITGGKVGIGLTDPAADFDVNGTVNVSGVSTFTGSISLPDSSGDLVGRVTFGDSDDLRIYHDGNNSIIQEVGAGDLRLSGNVVKLNNGNNTATMIKSTDGGSVELNYNNSKKLETTDSGIDVTGHIEADTLNVSGVTTVGTIGAGTAEIATINSTTINNTGHLESGFIDVGIVTANTGIITSGYIEQLSVEEHIFTTDGNTDVNSTFDRITISSDAQGRTFTNSDKVIYVAGSPGIGGLNDGQFYYVQTVGINTIKLYDDSALSSLVEVTPSGSDGVHTFRKTEVGIGTIEKFYSTSAEIKDINVTGVATVAFSTTTDAYIGFSTINNLQIRGPVVADLFDISNFVYDNNTGISTITVTSDLTFDAGDRVTLTGIAFTCPDGSGITTTVFPDGTQGFEYLVNTKLTDRIFTTNVGISTIIHTYDSGGQVSFGLNNSYQFPSTDGTSGQILKTDGSGTLTFEAPDTFGGNRIYVSATLGNDINDGKSAPVKTIKKAAQLAAAESYLYPVTIMVAGGNYVEDNPIILADDVAIVGDNLRRVVIRPKNKLRDCFRIRNGCYVTGVVFKDNVTFPAGAGVRHDILDQAGNYAKILVNGETGTATTYRTFINPVVTPVVSSASTVGICSRIDDLIKLTKDSLTDEKTSLPTRSAGNTDQEFTDAGNLIINNIGASAGVASVAYIPGNAVGWSTAGGGGNFTLTDTQITGFEEEVHNIVFGIADDLRYGGTFGNEYTLKKIRDLVVGTPSFAFDYIVSFDDPLDPTTSRDGYVGLSSDKPRITQSPYIQNCSIISFLGANGCNVDGSKIIQENEPIVEEEAEVPFVGDVPDQGKSMVANAFTAVTFGGIGWKVSNAGYAQIVSCFQIFCQIGSYAQSGGYLSITNSATNFGLYALRASGFRAQAFDFDKGFVFSDGTSGANQTLRVGGLKRAEQDLYVLRFINDDTGVDQTENFKTAGITTSLSSSGINTTTDRIDISGVSESLVDSDGLLYIAPSNENQIGGLVNDTTYYIKKIGTGTTATLHFDDELRNQIDLTDVPAGIHTFTKVAEEFIASEILERSTTYQNLTLSDAIGVGVTFVPGTSISQVRSDNAVAVGFAVTWTSSVLTVSVENSIDADNATARVLFQTTSTADAGSGDGKIGDENDVKTSINAVESRSDLHTINFKVDSTITGNPIIGITGLPKLYQCHLHRPSIVNSSAHTWEYAGSGIDYNALPQNGGIANADFEQYNENGGQVFTSGTNELGDFKVGKSITAFNRTGNIDFQNKVTIGQLDSLELSLSGGVKITEISISRELGLDEIGGPSDARLTTQAAQYGYLTGHLGPFIDQNKSTAPIPSAIPQLNSQGLLDAGMIPAQIRFNNVFETNVSGGRTDLCNDIPAIEVLKSDIVTEEFVGAGETTTTTSNFTMTFENESQFLVLSSDTDDYAFDNGDIITASQNGAVGVVTAPTHISYGSTGLVKGVINTISVSAGGTGYNVAGIYSGVNLVSTTGIGTSAVADVTVNSLGEVENINIRRGGRYYASGDTFIIDPQSLGGVDVGFTTFTASVTNVDTRLYVDLIENKLQFFASQSVPDFISDGTVSAGSTDFSTVYTETFLPTSVGVGGSVFFSENAILIDTDTFEFDDGDPVLYTVSGGTVLGQLENNKTYFVNKVGVNSVRLSTTYDGNNIVTLDTSGTGTHQLKRLGVSTATDFIVFKDHGFTVGKSVKYITDDGPAGITTGSYYFIGSVVTNGFTLHDVRQDALNSINGSSINARNLTTVGSGIGTFNEQNVTFVSTLNTSSNNKNNFSILVSSADIDASNVISGVLEADRLATDGTPSDTTFLRGDSSWAGAVQSIAVGVGTTSAINVVPGTPSVSIVGSGINTYYGNLELSVQGISTDTALIGADEYSQLGVVRLRWKDGSDTGPFRVTNDDFLVDLQSTASGTNDNSIDAYRFQGQTLADVVNLSTQSVNGNSRGTLTTLNGGTGAANNTATTGQMLVCNTAGEFNTSSAPTLNGKLGIGFFSATASDVKGTLDIDQLASHDTTSTTTTATTQTSVFSFDKTVFRTAKLIISITDADGSNYHSTEMLVIHDGTNAYKTEYGSIFTSQLATFAVDVSGTNVRILATPASTNSITFKIYASGLIRV